MSAFNCRLRREEFMKKQFTPGPWEVMGQDIQACPAEIGHPSGEFRIAQVRKSIYEPDKNKSIPNWEANAHLIAAAPEMFEALVKIQDTLLEKHNKGENHTFELLAISDILSKAQGMG